MQKEWLQFFDQIIPYIDSQEQADIEASFSPANNSEDDFVEITHWFNHEDNYDPHRTDP